MRIRCLPALSLALIGLLAFVALAGAERVQQGHLVASLDGSISPRALPRHGYAPVSLRLSGDLHTDDGEPLPQLHTLELGLGGSGRLDAGGLPTCTRAELRAASPEVALRNCRSAQVGSGRLDVAVSLENQPPFNFHASLRAFNARGADGAPIILLHVFGSSPPTSFVLPFLIEHRAGRFPTVLSTELPPGLGPWPHLARFEITLGRRFRIGGRRRSYLLAHCPLPPRFDSGIFPFAQATYSLPGPTSLAVTIARGCRASAEPPPSS